MNGITGGLLACLLLCVSFEHCHSTETVQRSLCADAKCLTHSPRLVRVVPGSGSSSNSQDTTLYHYQVPRRVRKVVRRKIIGGQAADVGDDVPEVVEDSVATHLFDHVQVTRRPQPTETCVECLSSHLEPPRYDSNSDTSRNEVEAEGIHENVSQRPAASRATETADVDLTSLANILEEASWDRLSAVTEEQPAHPAIQSRPAPKTRRRIVAKKLLRKEFLGKLPLLGRKIAKVIVVRKKDHPQSRIIPGLNEIYHDDLLNRLISEEYSSLKPSPGIMGLPGVDYPIYQQIPVTRFRCRQQRYWGMYADTETQCQVWHYCDQDGHQHSFLCPNGTVFNQVTFTCDWWYNVDCNNAVQLYVTNEALSLLPAPPLKTFPEDFNGPIVDWYIYQRHQEKAYRKEKFLRQLEEGKEMEAIKFLETHDVPPWFTAHDKTLYMKLKSLERKSKNRPNKLADKRLVKKELKMMPLWHDGNFLRSGYMKVQ